LVDLHTHTDASDGSLAPAELIEAAREAGLDTLAITDHDTFAGFEKAEPLAGGLKLVRGIELNTRYHGRSVHLLAYFTKAPGAGFVSWLQGVVEARRDRNRRLIEKLNRMGVGITLAEVEALGRTLAGRPHFARLLVEKGYAASRDKAFSDFIGETGRAFVERDAPELGDTIRLVNEAGALASLAHPIRLGRRDFDEEEKTLAAMRREGLPAIEVFHSDHSPEDAGRYLRIAAKYGFRATGGSDFHGSYKPGARLGYSSNGSVPIPDSVLEALLKS
jgi:predicted metal-dependent phosphoesterase TrpH